MKKITIQIEGDTESSIGADYVKQALRTLAIELAEPGMLGGSQDFGSLRFQWTSEIVEGDG